MKGIVLKGKMKVSRQSLPRNSKLSLLDYFLCTLVPGASTNSVGFIQLDETNRVWSKLLSGTDTYKFFHDYLFIFYLFFLRYEQITGIDSVDNRRPNVLEVQLWTFLIKL